MASTSDKNQSTEIAPQFDENSLAGLSSEDRLKAIMGQGNVQVGGTEGTLVEKAQLVGVPFMVEEITYRPGSGEWSPGIRYDYLTLKGIVLTTEFLSQLGVNPDELNGLKPGQPIIFNDGSTGIAREMTAKLHRSGAITVDGTQGQMQTRGPKGSSAFDQPRELWENGAEEASKGIRLGGNYPAIVLPKGLRASEYDGPNGRSTTYYEG